MILRIPGSIRFIIVSVTAVVVAGAANAGSGVFNDCDACPEMVAVAASPEGFKIGSPESEKGHRDTEKQKAVSIQPFAIGRFEVSVAEYKACVTTGACPPPEWLEPNGQHNIETGVSGYYKDHGAAVTGDRQPVVGVSFDNAAAYVKWLSEKTGKAYRLPSEAEWEYAARAGSTTAYWWGGDIGQARANCRGCGSAFDGKSLAPIDSFEPNPWGLHNVHGNVWEWVADYWCGSYDGTPDDGTPRAADDCPRKDAPGLRVLRGGSGFYAAEMARAAIRLRNEPGFRNLSVGFRVARSLDK